MNGTRPTHCVHIATADREDHATLWNIVQAQTG